jgi:hypothetical protein
MSGVYVDTDGPAFEFYEQIKKNTGYINIYYVKGGDGNASSDHTARCGLRLTKF